MNVRYTGKSSHPFWPSESKKIVRAQFVYLVSFFVIAFVKLFFIVGCYSHQQCFLLFIVLDMAIASKINFKATTSTNTDNKTEFPPENEWMKKVNI